MNDHPLYLPAPLIPAFVAGRVSLLVEPLKVQPVTMPLKWGLMLEQDMPHFPGDRLWLREAWAETDHLPEYRADHRQDTSGWGWKSPVTMPKRASRAWGEVEAVDVKRVQDVTEGDCEAAGFSGFMSLDGSDCESPREQLQDHFHYTYGPDAWDRNPWCAFTRVKVHMGSLEEKG